MEVVSSTVVVGRQNYSSLSNILFLLQFFNSSPSSTTELQQTSCPRTVRIKAPHSALLRSPSAHTSYETLKLHFCLLSNDSLSSPSFSLPILFRVCDCFFSSVSRTFLTESTRCQHFPAASGALPCLLVYPYLELVSCGFHAIT